MNNIIKIRKDCEHDNCYICDKSLVHNYHSSVAVIKNKTGAHFICKQCFIQIFVKKSVPQIKRKCADKNIPLNTETPLTALK